MNRFGNALVVGAVLLAGVLRPDPMSARTRSTIVRVPLFGDDGADTLDAGVLREREGLSVRLGDRGSVEASTAAPHGFSAVGLVVRGRFPAGSRVDVRLEVSADGIDFGAPVALPIDGDLSDEKLGLQVHGLLLLPAAEFRFCRWTLDLTAQTSAPLVSSLELHFIDASSGPDERELLEARERHSAMTSRLAATVPKPSVVSRAQWGARTAPEPYGYCQPTTHMAVHYTASQGLPDADLADCAEHMRAIQAFHMDSRGWNDIGYNYVVCRHGTLFEGRGGGDNVQAAHDGYNCDSMGVSAIGYFHPPYNEPVPQAMLHSFIEILAWKAGQNGIDPQGASVYRGYGALMNHIYGHRNVKNMSCPGDALYAELQFLRDEVERRLEDVPTPRGNLVGLILDSVTQARLSGAVCALTPGSASLVTGPDGYYRFEGLPAGQTYTVNVTHAGHKPQAKSRMVEAGIDNWNSLWLEPVSTATVAIR